MKIELSWYGVGKQRKYFATRATAGRPRHTDVITKSKKLFVESSTREGAIEGLKEAVGFQPANLFSN